jgi:hypothetical protein
MTNATTATILPATEPHNKPGYHVAVIDRGVIGELSKVHEEVLEALDAEAQGADLMVLQELSDIVGAIRLYLANHHPTLALHDLEIMADITARAFTNGRRS